ncbi:hypothetical protein BVC93_24975 [Mycobacterium sp. MS1601]|uniref:DUF1876 domain-containing protein n=1 Tax=Mycobacterium sp. MS1601 TaxID=1936029 RepID=UPI0009792649|nr:DUF1876 domain-containing protein [Mycobacterium sp. MS1601]AQA05117.1 hypothetical protein BVC93_24975 [Mycobacterium sp. MS1601]
MHGKHWSVDVTTDEHDGTTKAVARLHWGERTLVAEGRARCNPADRDIADIGAELAAARALTDLAQQLRSVTRHHIEAATNAPVDHLN